MKFALVCFIAALALTNAYVLESTPDVIPTELVETNNKRKDFGDVIELLEANTAEFGDENPIDKFLSDYADQIHKEAAEHAKIHAQNEKDCADEEEYRTNEIKEGIDSAAASAAQIDLCEAESIEAAQLFAEATYAHEIYTNQLDSLENLRKEQIITYTDRTTELHRLIKGLQSSHKFLDELEASVSKPSAKALVQLNSLLQIAVAHGLYEHMMPVYEALAQVDGAFNTNDIEAVRKALQDFETNASKALAEVEAKEKKDAHYYATEKARLQTILGRLANQAKRAEDYKEEMDSCVKRETEINKMANQKVKHNEEALLHALEVCEADEKAYAAAVKNTARELKLLHQLRRAILQLTKSYLKNVLPSVGSVIKVKKTRGDTHSLQEKMKVCRTLHLHHIQDPDCDNLPVDITTL